MVVVCALVDVSAAGLLAGFIGPYNSRMQSSPSTARSEAHRKAFDVVGLYGDPSVAWSIMLVAELHAPGSPDDYRAGLAALVAKSPDCGPPPSWDVVDEDAWQAQLHTMGTRLYVETEPLVRGASTADGRFVAVAAHHGVVDGLGLLALMGALTGEDLRSGVRGVDPSSAERLSFLVNAVKHVGSALVRPPRRFRAVDPDKSRAGEWLVARNLPKGIDSSRLIAASCRALEQWGATGGRRNPVAVAVGASRRSGDAPAPDRDTVLLRLVGSDFTDPVTVRNELRAATPEPDSPTTSAGGIGPLVAKALAGRLGSTVLVSNLGIIEGSQRIERLWLYPAVNGPCGVAVGSLTIDGKATLTVRVARRDFSSAAVERLTDTFVQAIESVSAQQRAR